MAFSSLLHLPRLTVIHHGLTEISSRPLPRANSVVSTFAFIGRLVTSKGVRVLLEATRILRQRGFHFRVRIIGDGPDRAELEGLVRDFWLEDTFLFLGYISSDNLEENLKDTCAIVMPSLAGEVFGLVAAENMQRGRLVIASDIGALCEVLGAAGLTFITGDATSLANCMQRVLESPSLAEKLGEKARKHILENFRESAMIHSHLKIYKDVGG